MTHIVINLGVLLEIDTQSCILVRIRTDILKIWGIQTNSTNQTTSQRLGLNCPPILNMSKPIRFGCFETYRSSENGQWRIFIVVIFNQNKFKSCQIEYFSQDLSDIRSFLLLSTQKHTFPFPLTLSLLFPPFTSLHLCGACCFVVSYA